jgi:ADP-heptose:LPS heptosyltransferase
VIIIAPFAQKLHNGKENPKNYPHWKKLVDSIECPIVQVGRSGEQELVTDCRFDLTIPELRQLIRECKTWIGVDSFFQHLAWDEGKPGIVLWSVSDPLIFGHPENVNLLKHRDYLAVNQFLHWDYTKHNPDAFVEPQMVIKHLTRFL